MIERKYKQEAKNFCEAIRLFTENHDNLENFESYLAIHFKAWLKEYANTPEKIAAEMLHFANIE